MVWRETCPSPITSIGSRGNIVQARPLKYYFGLRGTKPKLDTQHPSWGIKTRTSTNKDGSSSIAHPTVHIDKKSSKKIALGFDSSGC